jgi:cystathionine beta-lyase/cystathionine gamma-synthase
VFPDHATTVRSFTDRAAAGYLYARFEHATGVAVEETLAGLLGGERALLFSSGMAALAAVLDAYVPAGSRVLASRELYGGTLELLARGETAGRFAVDRITAPEFARAGEFVRPDTALILAESPTNPCLRLVDLEAMAASLGASRPRVVLDGTFAPLGHPGPGDGVDLVMHSATKYLGGHDDLTAGVVVGDGASIETLAAARKVLGSNPDAQTAWLLDRGRKTLALRWERQCANAAALAAWLETHPRVERVLYPQLAGHPDHELARRRFPVGGAVVSFVPAGGEAAAVRVYDRVRVVQRAPSLGGVESTLVHPATSSHRGLTPDERAALGIEDGLLRLSVGIEDLADLRRDLGTALDA